MTNDGGMDIDLTVKVHTGVECLPILYLLEHEVISKRNLSMEQTLKEAEREGEQIIAIVFQIAMDGTQPKAETQPLINLLKDVPPELDQISLLTTQWEQFKAVMVHRELEYNTLREICLDYHNLLVEEDTNPVYTIGWLMSTVTTIELESDTIA